MKVGQVGSKQEMTTVGEFAPFTYGKGLPAGKRNLSGHFAVFGSNGIVGWHDTALTDGPTVVIGRKGTVGAVHYWPDPCWPIDTTYYTTGSDADLVRYRYYALGALGLADMNTHSAVPGLNRDDAHSLDLPLPPLPEQRRIASILGALDDKIKLNQRMNETLEQMTRALYKSWFVDFDPVHAKMDGIWRRGESMPGLPAEMYDLFPDRLVPSELGEIPDGWQVQSLGDCIELAYGKPLKADARKPGNVPVFGSNGQVGWHDQKLVMGPGIVVGRKGNPGTVSWCQSDFFPIDTTFYVVPKAERLDLHFLFHALAGQDLPAIVADSAVPGLNRNLAYMNIQLVPDEKVADNFRNFARTIFVRRDQLDQEARALATQRDALMPELVSGSVLTRST